MSHLLGISHGDVLHISVDRRCDAAYQGAQFCSASRSSASLLGSAARAAARRREPSETEASASGKRAVPRVLVLLLFGELFDALRAPLPAVPRSRSSCPRICSGNMRWEEYRRRLCLRARGPRAQFTLRCGPRTERRREPKPTPSRSIRLSLTSVCSYSLQRLIGMCRNQACRAKQQRPN